MIEKNLGLTIDIHGGGHDLIFPHHENELAQGVCAHGGEEYARYWMHNGFLTLDAEKMSKSLGNVKLVHELIERIPGEVIRWALLSAHYRAPLDWTNGLLAQSKTSLDRLYGVLQRAGAGEAAEVAAPEAFVAALSDDLNTPKAMAELFALAKAVETAPSKGARAAAKAELLAAGKLLGFLQQDPYDWFEAGAAEDLKPRIEALLAERIKARADKNWAEADRIRAELTELNVEVLDGKDGASWRFKG
jgi:cysteinyl-tRNA synthetase